MPNTCFITSGQPKQPSHTTVRERRRKLDGEVRVERRNGCGNRGANTNRRFVGGGARDLSSAIAGKRRQVHSCQPSQCERRDALTVSIERSRRPAEIQGYSFGVASMVTSFRMLLALQIGACACTHLESSHAALCPCILALHIIHVRRFILTLVVEPAAK